jgi:hypothetical protein
MEEANQEIENKKEGTEKPILQFSVPCDGVAKGPNNKPVFVGIFSSILRPIVIPQFFIANRWINGVGEFEQIIKILDPELKEIAKSEVQKFKLDSKAKAADLFSGFINLNFSKSGVYWISTELNGELAMSFPLPVFDK